MRVCVGSWGLGLDESKKGCWKTEEMLGDLWIKGLTQRRELAGGQPAGPQLTSRH